MHILSTFFHIVFDFFINLPKSFSLSLLQKMYYAHLKCMRDAFHFFICFFNTPTTELYSLRIKTIIIHFHYIFSNFSLTTKRFFHSSLLHSDCSLLLSFGKIMRVKKFCHGTFNYDLPLINFFSSRQCFFFLCMT